MRMALVLTGAILAVAATAIAEPGAKSPGQPTATTPVDSGPWRALFDGRTLRNWKVTSFGGEGSVKVDKGQIVLHAGDPLTGITWTGDDLPRIDYELSFEAMKISGNDFFSALTFPVGEAPCSLVVGGWGGTVVGLSSLDGLDASDNETSRNMTFAKNRWYRIAVRVTKAKIEAWIDDALVVDVSTAGRKISIRPEVEASRPLGVASFNTKAALRNIRARRL